MQSKKKKKGGRGGKEGRKKGHSLCAPIHTTDTGGVHHIAATSAQPTTILVKSFKIKASASWLKSQILTYPHFLQCEPHIYEISLSINPTVLFPSFLGLTLIHTRPCPRYKQGTSDFQTIWWEQRQWILEVQACLIFYRGDRKWWRAGYNFGGSS